ncbi:MAG: proton-conducting transporter membrane subunit, partial [Anaerolineae bacterium]
IVKALLFMCVGLVIRATGRRSIHELGGLGRAMPLAAACTGVGALAVAGTPPLALFDSEWMIFAGGFQSEYLWLGVGMVLASLLTVAYALWFWGRVFFGVRFEAREPGAVSMFIVVPTVSLAFLALIEGLFPAPLFDWAQRGLSLILGGAW